MTNIQIRNTLIILSIITIAVYAGIVAFSSGVFESTQPSANSLSTANSTDIEFLSFGFYHNGNTTMSIRLEPEEDICIALQGFSKNPISSITANTTFGRLEFITVAKNGLFDIPVAHAEITFPDDCSYTTTFYGPGASDGRHEFGRPFRYTAPSTPPADGRDTIRVTITDDRGRALVRELTVLFNAAE